MFKARRLPGFVDTPLTRGHRDAMPFLLSPGRFAALAARAIAGGGSYQVIPWQMARVAKLLPCPTPGSTPCWPGPPAQGPASRRAMKKAPCGAS